MKNLKNTTRSPPKKKKKLNLLESGALGEAEEGRGGVTCPDLGLKGLPSHTLRRRPSATKNGGRTIKTK